MAYEVLGFRGNRAKHFFEIDSVKDLFADPDVHVNKIPEQDRYNIYYSVADVVSGTTRHEGTQLFVPFDIDDIDTEEEELTLQTALDAIEASWEDVLSLASGNGLQFLVQLDEPIGAEDYSNGYFENHIEYYNAYCERINLALEAKKLKGKCDPSVFKITAMMRVPNTLNRKKDKPERLAQILNDTCKPFGFNIKKFGKSESPAKKKLFSVSTAVPIGLAVVPPTDTDAVLAGCGFILQCFAKPEQTKEYQWYAALSVVAKLKDGRKLCHKMSSGHPGYSEAETDRKIDQALEKAGPRTCANINTLWDGCFSCIHFNSKKIISPIQIKGDKFIRTKATGFRVESIVDGKPKLGKISYEDLRKNLEQEGGFFTDPKTSIIYRWDDKKHYWYEWDAQEVMGYADQHVFHEPNTAECKEFMFRLQRKNHMKSEDLRDKQKGKINLLNGVLDIQTGELLNHDRGYGFNYCLPYGYDPDAKCPTFDRHLDDITCSRDELKNLLTEFMAYSLSQAKYTWAKILILLGHGNNGKSTFINLMKAMVDKSSYSTVALKHFNNPTYLAQIENVLFNIRSESGTSMYDCEEFKEVTAGDSFTARRHYIQPYSVNDCRCKFIVACNQLPKTYDDSDGFFRRLMIIPFDASFNGPKEDKNILDLMVKERSGILNRVIEGYKRLYTLNENGQPIGFTKSEVSRQKMLEYRREVIPEFNFIKEHLEYNDDSRANTRHIYKAYVDFCKDNNYKPKSNSSFFASLKKEIRDYPRRIQKSNGDRFIKGLKLNYNYDLSYRGNYGAVEAPKTYYS